jgi:hypothetical protein
MTARREQHQSECNCRTRSVPVQGPQGGEYPRNYRRAVAGIQFGAALTSQALTRIESSEAASVAE